MHRSKLAGFRRASAGTNGPRLKDPHDVVPFFRTAQHDPAGVFRHPMTVRVTDTSSMRGLLMALRLSVLLLLPSPNPRFPAPRDIGGADALQ